MENSNIILLKSGVNSDVNILEPEEQENILGGATKCIKVIDTVFCMELNAIVDMIMDM